MLWPNNIVILIALVTSDKSMGAQKPKSDYCCCYFFLFLKRPPPVLDALGRVISEAPPDQWEAR